MNLPKASLIIRTKNEERWILPCLEMVFKQEFRDFEVIIVDDQSTDRSRDLASKFDVKIVSHTKRPYRPGFALNLGIAEARGEFVVCLSGHCIPVNEKWLGNLLRAFADPSICGVYGRQEPLPYSSPRDKRDLWTIFGLDPKIQTRDSFFHNANSALRRSLWKKYPFDEEATNIEDRLWAKKMIEHKYHIKYEPEASVYHWHGIHQDGDEERCRGVVRILQQLQEPQEKGEKCPSVTAIIPVRGNPISVNKKTLLHYTIQRALEAECIDRVVVSTDSEKTAELAKSLGAEVPFLRPAELSRDFVGLAPVIKYTVEQLRIQGKAVNTIAILQQTHPFRAKGLLDKLIREMIRTHVDTLIPVRKNTGFLFKKDSKGQVDTLSRGFMPQRLQDPVYEGIPGIACIVKASNLIDDSIVGTNVGIFPMEDPFGEFEINSEAEVPKLAPFLASFWSE